MSSIAGCERAPEFSAREREVVGLVVEGLTNAEIAARLGVSVRTVQAHIAAAFRRSGARSRTELAVLALRCGLVVMACPRCGGVRRESPYEVLLSSGPATPP
jgi:DNA-binding NarL/FixJ family response regulator